MRKRYDDTNIVDFDEVLLDQRVNAFLEYEEQTERAASELEIAIERSLATARKAGVGQPNLVTHALRAYLNFRIKDDPRGDKRGFSDLRGDLHIISILEQRLRTERKLVLEALEAFEEQAPPFSPVPIRTDPA